MVMQFRLQGDPAAQLKRSFAQQLNKIGKNVQDAGKELGETIVRRGRQDIARAGNFGPRWTSGLTYTLRPRGTLGFILEINHSIDYFKIFEKGGRIVGKPLLWLPLPGSGVKGPPSQYSGRLFSAKSAKGTPLLFDYDTKKPVFFGVSSVNMPKKFHLEEIIRDTVKEFAAIYRSNRGR